MRLFWRRGLVEPRKLLRSCFSTTPTAQREATKQRRSFSPRNDQAKNSARESVNSVAQKGNGHSNTDPNSSESLSPWLQERWGLHLATENDSLRPPSNSELAKALKKAVESVTADERVVSALKRLSGIMQVDWKELKGFIDDWQNQTLPKLQEWPHGELQEDPHFALEGLKLEYSLENQAALTRAVYASVFQHIISQKSSKSAIAANRIQDALDFRRPEALYPHARLMPRHFILHVGPTNSGKTHHALVALAKARTGVYAGPLRLLAREIGNRFRAGQAPGLDGKARDCNMITGEEVQIFNPSAGLQATTVEMVSSESFYDVAVIDEIQLISDPFRGSAWLRAVLCVRAPEVHLCGEEAAVDVIQSIVERTGETLEIRRYNRLTPLQVSDTSLSNNLRNVKAGDVVIVFSRSSVYALKRVLERIGKVKVAVCYGALPPEAREEQAKLFNNGTLDVLVATDAIGMGLNLKIRRVVFGSIKRYTRSGVHFVTPSQVKQIGGRAGRFGHRRHNSALLPDADPPEPNETNQDAGLVTSLHEDNLERIKEAFAAQPEPILRATLGTDDEQIGKLQHLCAPGTTYTDLLAMNILFARTEAPFRISACNRINDNAEIVAKVPGLNTKEQFAFCAAPIQSRNAVLEKALTSFALGRARGKCIRIEAFLQQMGLSLPTFADFNLGAKDRHVSWLVSKANDLETTNRVLTLYQWLSYRFPVTFPSLEQALELSAKCNDLLTTVLSYSRDTNLTKGSNIESKDSSAKESGKGFGRKK